jgi:hypothetical protein
MEPGVTLYCATRSYDDAPPIPNASGTPVGFNASCVVFDSKKSVSVAARSKCALA